jgi:hypothetical protein
VKRENNTLLNKGIVRFYIQQFQQGASGNNVLIDETNNTLATMKNPGAMIDSAGKAIDLAAPGVQALEGIYDAWQSLVDEVGLVMEIINILSEVL